MGWNRKLLWYNTTMGMISWNDGVFSTNGSWGMTLNQFLIWFDSKNLRNRGWEQQFIFELCCLSRFEHWKGEIVSRSGSIVVFRVLEVPRNTYFFVHLTASRKLNFKANINISKDYGFCVCLIHFDMKSGKTLLVE